MCCFTMPMRLVSDTKIFVRDAEDGFQYLVYSMDFAAEGEGAMVLPLPVAARIDEDDVQFLNLEGYRDFFTAMRSGFPEERAAGAPELSSSQLGALADSRRILEVHSVGRFEASFVPTLTEFDRLDPRFQIPRNVWDQLSQYRDYGFAVVKLRSARGHRAQTLHPIAMKFPRRDPGQIFVPTVHIHDGRYHSSAHFDHDLYCQPGSVGRMLRFAKSFGPAASFLDVEKTVGIVDPSAHCFRQTLRGELRNADLVISAESTTRWHWLDFSGVREAPEQRNDALEDLLFYEVILPNAAAIEACRRGHPRLVNPIPGRNPVYVAVTDLRLELKEPIEDAREKYRQRMPIGQVNVDALFDNAVNKELRTMLEADTPRDPSELWMRLLRTTH